MNNNIVHILHIHPFKIVFWSTLGVFVISALLYVYFLNATILHIVERKSAERSIADTNIAISELEYEYLALSSTVTLEYAHSLGFVEAEDTLFARRDIHTGFAQRPTQ
jgi:hypothetical protein